MSFHRAEGILTKSSTSVRKLMGLVKATSMFRIYKEKDEKTAEELIVDTQKRSLALTYRHGRMCTHTHTHKNKMSVDSLIYRLLEEMKATSPDTELQWTLEYFCITASKPQD